MLDLPLNLNWYVSYISFSLVSVAHIKWSTFYHGSIGYAKSISAFYLLERAWGFLEPDRMLNAALECRLVYLDSTALEQFEA